MYSSRPFIESRPEVLLAMIKQAPLGLLITHKQGITDAFHLPFVFEGTDTGAGSLHAHVARGNPVWRDAGENDDVLLIFRGEQGYISPNWYPGKQENHRQVPTWNYQAVHVRGKLVIHDDEEYIRHLLTILTHQHESGQPVPWQLSDAPEDYLNAMVKAVVGVEVVISEMSGIMKLSQNRNAADREGAASNLIKNGHTALGNLILAAAKESDPR